MRYTKITDVKELPTSLKEIVKLQVVDGSVEAVEIKVGNDMLRIVKADAYNSNLKLLTPQPMKEVVKWIVSGSISDVSIAEKEFESDFDAQNFINQKKTDFYCNSVDLTISPKSVFVEETKV